MVIEAEGSSRGARREAEIGFVMLWSLDLGSEVEILIVALRV